MTELTVAFRNFAHGLKNHNIQKLTLSKRSVR